MKVSFMISSEYTPPYAVIYADKLTDEIRRAAELFDEKQPVTGYHGDRLMILKPEDIYMVRIEGGDTTIYCEKEQYRSKKRLYEISAQLGSGFMQISKSTLVNLSYLDSTSAGLGGTVQLKLKNGCTDYISRKYLPVFKKYLGL